MTPHSLISQEEIENRIFTIRGQQVMIDRDLAEVYQVTTKRLNEQVKRNKLRFPESFIYQLNDLEKSELVANCDRFKKLKYSSTNPFAFTEQGVAMLSAVLRSETAIRLSIQIIQAFVALRKIASENQLLLTRLEKVELKQLETDQKFDKIFKALESKDIIPTQGIFFEGQVFDAYELASRIIRSAKVSIILIDNYISETTLAHLTKRNPGVRITLLTKKITNQLELDISKANEQYAGFEAKVFDKSHDRFLIIDHEEVYHLGASLKDLGKKWFAFSRLEKESVKSVMDSLP